MKYKTFTRLLRSLNDNREELSKLKEKIDDFLYEMTGVKGVRFDVTAVNGNPSVNEERNLDMIEKYNVLLKEYETTEKSILLTVNTLNRMPTELRTLLEEVYVKGKSFTNVGREHGYSDHGLWKLMKREAEKYL